MKIHPTQPFQAQLLLGGVPLYQVAELRAVEKHGYGHGGYHYPPPLPPQRVSIEEFEATMREIRKENPCP